MRKSFKIIILSLVLFCSVSSFVSLHKYYVSVTDIDFVANEQSVQIISRLFIDDFDAVLQDRYDSIFHLEEESTKDKRFEYIQKYYSKKLLIQINGQQKKINLLGIKFEEDKLISYFEIDSIIDVKSIKVINKLLHIAHPNQQNITHLNINGRKKSFLLIKDKDYNVLKF